MKPELITVKVISRKSAAALVEWVDESGLHRATIPAKAIGDRDEVNLKELELGIPYGTPWSEVVKLKAKPADIERELRARGVWTVADALANPALITQAVQAAYGLDVAAILQAANTLARGEQNA